MPLIFSPAAATGAGDNIDDIKALLKSSLRQFKDFPTKGVLFEDIMPIFQNPAAFNALLTGLRLQIEENFSGANKPDVIVGLDARGFLFGPTLALMLDAAFVPVRKRGKFPGPTVSAKFEKEYGSDIFEMQADAIKPGQKVIIVDDIIATGGSAKAAGELTRKLGGEILEYIFLMELDFLKGREKLDAPVYTLLSGQPTKLQ
ncbi:phosphoribosyltransferase-like protein [Dipodascopsis tothii]|uniref:phosphoribosyltransferase-like protein n=1 Tax=Dipodascopsis tothii TaxID=44089 RepID=UPI0034CDF386